ncbi:GLIPR1-like protein 1 [Denticeps clupeoides]|uniref:SCP domain-containing protein n=1 Tax=Denticeps clupeoides TaxID=299321 RepID=A0AAY4F081_9TELE|nr:GLIPR1-like protein 1 [Denticeps clupeoides]
MIYAPGCVRTMAGLRLCFVVILGLAVLMDCSDAHSLPDITDPQFISDCVQTHNQYRSATNPFASNMLYMTWDDALAVTAQAWARFCIRKHNIYLREAKRVHPTFPSVGENLWFGYPPSHFSVELAMKNWVNDELKYYNYGPNACSTVCGHYTQAVWADSYKVGCAVQICPNGVEGFSTKESALFVCNYAPAGNLNGARPYEEGKPCSSCGGGRCENNLCRDPVRDKLIAYNWSPDWDPEKRRCGAFCKAVLVLRPLALMLIFLSAYTVKIYYPDMFAYE